MSRHVPRRLRKFGKKQDWQKNQSREEERTIELAHLGGLVGVGVHRGDELPQEPVQLGALYVAIACVMGSQCDIVNTMNMLFF